MTTNSEITVWDPLVRLFHWTLVISFSIAYLTDDDYLTPHSWAGYMTIGLVSVRIIWGFTGTKHARFSTFIYRPGTVIDYVKAILANRPKRHVGHNPAGGYMVLALIVSILLTGISGMAVYGVEEFSGPLAPYLADLPHYWGDVFEELHEFLANLSLLLVILHIAGVVLTSAQHRENLALAMITGRKKGPIHEEAR